MATTAEAIERLTIVTEYRTVGAEQYEQRTRGSAKAHDDVAVSVGRSDRAAEMNDRRLRASMALRDREIAYLQQVRAANDNLSQSYNAANDNIEGNSRSFEEQAEQAAKVASAVKLAATAAYLYSPAFRALANPLIADAMKAAGVATVSFASVALRVLSPVLTFLARLSVPVAVITTAFQLLSSAIGQGAALLEKYGDAQRSLVSGVDDNLANLTKFQDAGLSAEQVQRATELGARLNDAKKIISDFFRVHLDLNDAGLKFQAAWVRVVELIAAAVDKLNNLPQWAIAAMLGAATGAAVGSVVPVVGTAVGAVAGGVAGLAANWSMSGGSDSESPEDTEKALAIAKQRLAAGMGSESIFANRFGSDVNAIANVSKETKKVKEATDEARTAFDRATDSVTKNIAVMEASALSVGKGAGEQERLKIQAQLTEAAMREGGTEAVAKHAAEIAKLANQAAVAADNLALVQINNTNTRDRTFATMSSEDVQIAQQLQKIYPEITDALNSTEAAYIRNTNKLKDMVDVARGFWSDFTKGIRDGETAWESFKNAATNALEKIASKLSDKAFDQLLNIGTSSAGSSGGIWSWLTSLFASANGNVFDRGAPMQAFALGGVVTRPTVFPMASGAGLMGEAGPEAVMPLSRGSDGRLGVSAQGGGGSTYVDQSSYTVNPAGATHEQLAMAFAEIRKLRSEVPNISVSSMKKSRASNPNAYAPSS